MFSWWRTSRTVLIVSRTPDELTLNSAFLNHPHIRLLNARPGRRGLRVARRNRPNLIIEDLQPPEADGLEFWRDLRSDPKMRDIPLILVADPEMRDEVGTDGAEAMLDKPLVHREYFEAVRRFIPLPKRRTHRIPINLRFSWELGDRSGQAFSRDVSQDGAFLKSDRPLPVGTRLRITCSLPGTWEALNCDAVVRYNAGNTGHGQQLNGFGIEFQGLSADDLDRLEGFVASKLQRSLLAR